jgi:hypothetical protein
MDFNKIKAPLTCLVGSIVLMGVIYSVFFGVESIKTAIAISMAFIGVMSWKIIYFILGSIILCLECMIFNKYEKISKLHLNIVTVILLLFSILCMISNYELFSWKAAIFGAILYGFSRGVLELKEIPKENKDDRYFTIGVLSLILIAAIAVLFADKKEFEKTNEAVKPEVQMVDNTPAINQSIELEKVADKYKNEFKKLGFIKIVRAYKGSDKYSYIIDNFNMLKEGELVSNSEAAKFVSSEELKQIDFREITFELKDDKLFISGLSYDKRMISQEKVVSALSLVMDKIIMPKLRVIEKEIKTQRDNVESYKK